MLFKRKRNTKQDMTAKSYAYDALLEYNEDSLPISIPVSDKIIMFSYQEYFCNHAYPIYCDITKYDGVLMYLGTRYIILYDERLAHTTKHIVISKLLYYIQCGIADEYPGTYFTCNSISKSDEFANHFTCPDIILETCNIVSAEDIMYYCQVPFATASRKARYFKNGHDKFIFQSLERVLLDKFHLFIQEFTN